MTVQNRLTRSATQEQKENTFTDEQTEKTFVGADRWLVLVAWDMAPGDSQDYYATGATYDGAIGAARSLCRRKNTIFKDQCDRDPRPLQQWGPNKCDLPRINVNKLGYHKGHKLRFCQREGYDTTHNHECRMQC